MSFDKDTRNLLAKTVAACRRRLAGDVTDQLRGVFGLHPDGTVLPLALGVWFWGVCAALAAWTLVQKFGEPNKA